MTTRLTLTSWTALAIAAWALTLGYRWLLLAAVLTAAGAWIWRGALDWCERPPEPRDVHIVHPDGTTTKCEVAYVGIDERGVPRWKVTTRMHEGDKLRVEHDDPIVITATVDDAVIGAAWDGDGYRMEGK